jgi:hypothetical protein
MQEIDSSLLEVKHRRILLIVLNRIVYYDNFETVVLCRLLHRTRAKNAHTMVINGHVRKDENRLVGSELRAQS